MYVHCHNCHWEQDDFYDEGYNPAKFLAGFNEYLFGSKVNQLDVIIRCEEYKDGKPLRPDTTERECIARYYEDFARRIREMKWTTAKQFYADSDKKCPRCGSELDMD